MSAPLPLEGVRVLDLSRVLAGPYCTQILGDLGADVIKVEPPGAGDDVRTIPPFYEGGESHYFLALNRNKRSIVVDAKTDEGREVLLGLAATADLVVENFRPGVMQRLGLGFSELVSRKSDIILISISGFGKDGELADLPSFDLVTQARSGVMSITGEPDGPPTKMGLPMGDLGGGLWGAIAALSALLRRNLDPRPQHIDLSLLDGLVSMLGYLGQLSLLTGEAPERVGSSHHNIVPYGRFKVADGHIVLALHVGPFWERFCQVVGREDLLADPRFATTEARRDNREVLDGIVQDVLLKGTRSEWVETFTEAGVPHGPILDVTEAIQQEQVASRGLLREFRHPTAGDVKVVGSPMMDASGDLIGPADPPPCLGEHTRSVLESVLGYDEDLIDELARNGAIGGGSVARGSNEVR